MSSYLEQRKADRGLKTLSSSQGFHKQTKEDSQKDPLVRILRKDYSVKVKKFTPRFSKQSFYERYKDKLAEHSPTEEMPI